MQLTGLRSFHYARTEFAASPKSMASAGLISGWAHNRYRQTLKMLTDMALLGALAPFMAAMAT
jgi:hypothetical protein